MSMSTRERRNIEAQQRGRKNKLWQEAAFSALLSGRRRRGERERLGRDIAKQLEAQGKKIKVHVVTQTEKNDGNENSGAAS